MEHIYLSRRNLLTLLSKLDRKAAGEETACALVKNDNKHPQFAQSMDQIMVHAVEDEEYYTDRDAGPMHPVDEAQIKNGTPEFNELVAKVRQLTNAPMMECKKAVIATNGDLEAAVKWATDPRRDYSKLVTRAMPWDSRGWEPK